ncbi:MAG: hypothetical protein PF572_06000 [Patescibacteria group bacterium]|jgi:hypothetical protein|nr:hypothetical protein [Patescibacteria group bacterium]
MSKIETNTLSALKDVSGLATLNDFKTALKNKEFEAAEKWLQFVVDNKVAFCKISRKWDNWILKREKEIEEAKFTSFPF